jgi:hypothetical protein
MVFLSFMEPPLIRAPTTHGYEPNRVRRDGGQAPTTKEPSAADGRADAGQRHGAVAELELHNVGDGHTNRAIDLEPEPTRWTDEPSADLPRSAAPGTSRTTLGSPGPPSRPTLLPVDSDRQAARVGLSSRSESLIRGAVCGSPARTDLWEPGAGNRLGPPGDRGAHDANGVSSRPRARGRREASMLQVVGNESAQDDVEG